MSINHLNIAITSETIKSLNHISNRSICKPNYQLCNNTYTNRQLCNFLSRGRIRIRVNEVLEVPSWNRNRIILLIISNNGLIAQAKNQLKQMDQTRVNEVWEVPSWNLIRIILLIISNNGLIAQAKNQLKQMDQTISSQRLSINHNSNQSITSK